MEWCHVAHWRQEVLRRSPRHTKTTTRCWRAIAKLQHDNWQANGFGAVFFRCVTLADYQSYHQATYRKRLIGWCRRFRSSIFDPTGYSSMWIRNLPNRNYKDIWKARMERGFEENFETVRRKESAYSFPIHWQLNQGRGFCWRYQQLA